MSFFRLDEKALKEIKKKSSPHPWKKRIKAAYTNLYKYGHNSVDNPLHPKKEKIACEGRTQFVIIGNKTTQEFIYCYYLVKALYKYRKKEYEEPVIRGLLSIEWPKILRELRMLYGSQAFCIKTQTFVIANGELLGEAEDLEKYMKSKYVYRLGLNYYKESISQLVAHIHSSGRPCAYLDISINGEDIGTMMFLLYADLVPRTCENFLRLCEATKGGYSGTPVHRIVKECWIQCGGFGLKEDPNLGCENFIVPHDRRGVLCMTNDGRHVACSTQFFVLLQPASWMQHKYVAFGQLIEGDKVLSKIENVPTWYESPTQNIIIEKSGLLDLDCQHITINKNANEYITSHIEDLYELEELLCELILEKVFDEIERRELAAQGECPKEIIEAESPENSGQSEEISHEQVHSISYTSPALSEPSLPPKPTKPYYIPLTDVPYPGEIDSTHNLKKLLEGNYCHEADLEQNPMKIQQGMMRRKISIPEDLLFLLFDAYELEDDIQDRSDSSLDFDNEEIVQDYLRNNTDNVSFAGNTVKKIANIRGKLDIFDNKKIVEPHYYTDEELRIKRIAVKEYQSKRKKTVSISAASGSHSKIIRRPTGFVPIKDIAKLGIDSELLLRRENSDLELAGGKEIRDSLSIQEGLMVTLPGPRQSVLLRLFNDVAQQSTAEFPTLKQQWGNMYQGKEFFILKECTKLATDKDLGSSIQDLAKRTSPTSKCLDDVLKLQHGDRIYRKLSSDYVKTIDNLEHKVDQSIRTFEYSKIRPSISVEKYKLRNKKYSEMLKIQIN